jgi:hypothetical protein
VKRFAASEGEGDVRERVEAPQRNLLPQDLLLNGRAVDAFLWLGRSDAPMVQRVGALLLAFAYMLVVAALFATAVEQRSWPTWLFGCIFLAVPLVLLRTAFLRRPRRRTQRFQVAEAPTMED